MRLLPAPLLLALVSVGCSSPGTVLADARAGGEIVRAEDGAALWVRSSGSGDAGLLAVGASLVEPDLAPLLAGARAVFYDARGQGRSDLVTRPEEIGLAQDVRDLEAVREAAGLRRVTLLGWSYHALVAVEYALRHPERVERLLLVDPLPARREPWWRRFTATLVRRVDSDGAAALRAARRDLGGRELCEAFAAVTLRAYVGDPAALERMRGEPCAAPNLDPDRASALAQARVEALGEWDWRGRLGRLTVPTVVVHGLEGPVPRGASEEWAASIPGASLVELECGHLPWLEDPDAFAALLAEGAAQAAR